MIGYHAVAVIADAYIKGIRGYDADRRWRRWWPPPPTRPTGGSAHYMQLGYVPIDEEGEAAPRPTSTPSTTGASRAWPRRWASATSTPTFEKRATNWRNVCDPKTGFMRARLSDGQFREPFDPASAAYGTDYTEANAWQYSWYVPQDVAGLMRGLWRRREASRQARPDVRRQGRSVHLQERGGHHRSDRLVCARQRTEPPHRLSVRLRRRSRGKRSSG